MESFVAADKTFCVYLAKDEAMVRRHAEISGFPASKITEIQRLIDQTTSSARRLLHMPSWLDSNASGLAHDGCSGSWAELPGRVADMLPVSRGLALLQQHYEKN